MRATVTLITKLSNSVAILMNTNNGNIMITIAITTKPLHTRASNQIPRIVEMTSSINLRSSWPGARPRKQQSLTMSKKRRLMSPSLRLNQSQLRKRLSQQKLRRSIITSKVKSPILRKMKSLILIKKNHILIVMIPIILILISIRINIQTVMTIISSLIIAMDRARAIIGLSRTLRHHTVHLYILRSMTEIMMTSIWLHTIKHPRLITTSPLNLSKKQLFATTPLSNIMR